MSSRIDSLRASLPAIADHALITNVLNLRYLTGFTGDIGILLVSKDQALLLVDPRYTEQARNEASGVEVIEVRGNWGDGLTEALKKIPAGSIAFEAEEVTVAQFENWRDKIGESHSLVSVKDLASPLRRVKSSEEISIIEEAVLLTDEAFQAFSEWLKPGTTEIEGAWFIESYMRTHGAEAVAFPLIVAAGTNAALPHATPKNRPIQEHEPVVVDIGARVNGYCADLTRTICLGEPESRFTELYQLVLSAQLAAERGMHAGMTGKDADAIAREIIAAAGYEQAFGHGLGHGVGLAVHEDPRVSARSDHVLAAGEVVTVEPGVYLPGWGGIRIEDLVVIEDDSIRVLSQASKEPLIRA